MVVGPLVLNGPFSRTVPLGSPANFVSELVLSVRSSSRTRLWQSAGSETFERLAAAAAVTRVTRVQISRAPSADKETVRFTLVTAVNVVTNHLGVCFGFILFFKHQTHSTST